MFYFLLLLAISGRYFTLESVRKSRHSYCLNYKSLSGIALKFKYHSLSFIVTQAAISHNIRSQHLFRLSCLLEISSRNRWLKISQHVCVRDQPGLLYFLEAFQRFFPFPRRDIPHVCLSQVNCPKVCWFQPAKKLCLSVEGRQVHNATLPVKAHANITLITFRCLSSPIQSHPLLSIGRNTGD